MATVTIPKKEYEELIEKKLRYEYLRDIMEGDIFASPPTRGVDDILTAFKATRRYNQKFLKSLKEGLRRCSYFRI